MSEYVTATQLDSNPYIATIVPKDPQELLTALTHTGEGSFRSWIRPLNEAIADERDVRGLELGEGLLGLRYGASGFFRVIGLSADGFDQALESYADIARQVVESSFDIQEKRNILGNVLRTGIANMQTESPDIRANHTRTARAMAGLIICSLEQGYDDVIRLYPPQEVERAVAHQSFGILQVRDFCLVSPVEELFQPQTEAVRDDLTARMTHDIPKWQKAIFDPFFHESPPYANAVWLGQSLREVAPTKAAKFAGIVLQRELGGLMFSLLPEAAKQRAADRPRDFSLVTEADCDRIIAANDRMLLARAVMLMAKTARDGNYPDVLPNEDGRYTTHHWIPYVETTADPARWGS